MQCVAFRLKTKGYFNINWEELFSADAEDPEFIAFYNEAADKCIPTRLCKLNDGSTKSKYPENVIKLIRKKHRLRQKHLETKKRQRYPLVNILM